MRCLIIQVLALRASWIWQCFDSRSLAKFSKVCTQPSSGLPYQCVPGWIHWLRTPSGIRIFMIFLCLCVVFCGKPHWNWKIKLTTADAESCTCHWRTSIRPSNGCTTEINWTRIRSFRTAHWAYKYMVTQAKEGKDKTSYTGTIHVPKFAITLLHCSSRAYLKERGANDALV